MATKLEGIIEVIGQALFDLLDVENSKEDTQTNEDTALFIETAENGYSLIEWPESQTYMEEEWFKDEAVLALGSEERTGSSAYFIPIKRIIN